MLLLRTPLYSFKQFEDVATSKILMTPAFQAALFLASQSFFEELRKRDFDFFTLSEKQQHTLKKYLNRACYRSTPFGLFSSFSALEWAAKETTILVGDPVASLSLDFGLLHDLWVRYKGAVPAPSCRLQTNPSLSITAFDVRYLKIALDEDQRCFSMVSLPVQSFLKKLIFFCKEVKTRLDVSLYIQQNADATVAEAENFISELIAQQIFVEQEGPTVTGEDWADKIQLMAGVTKLEDSVSFSQNKTHNITSYELLETLREASSRMKATIPGISRGSQFYTLSSRSVVSGGLTMFHQKALQDGIFLWKVLAHSGESEELIKFKENFKRRYEDSEVSLLEALDSQLGVGYGAFDQIQNNYGFSSSHQWLSDLPNLAPNFKESVTTFLLDGWVKQQAEGAFQISISDEQIASLRSQTTGELPPSISVLFRTLEDQIYLEACGGPSALSLIGRFSFNDKVFKMAKTIAQEEARWNPEVIFAELTHVCHLHTANINRRPHLRDYEIPVLTASTIEEGKQIHLSDLMVSMCDNIVVLRSKRLGKRVVPRLSSAFNFTKNSLSIFRFLCDIQNQDLKAGFSFQLAGLVPGLSFYPRVVYKSCILHLAEWHLSAKEWLAEAVEGRQEVLKHFHERAEALRLPRYFSLVQGDNFLVFDRQNEEDVFFLFRELRNKEKFVLREFPFTEDGVFGKDNRPLVPQYIATLQLRKETYSQPSSRSSKRKAPSKANTHDWVYFKIYCHPVSTDTLLVHHLLPAIDREQRKGNIEGWFWVRYFDSDAHIRLRLKPASGMMAVVRERFTEVLTKLLAKNLVSVFQPAIYFRELDRYSSPLIEGVESVFTESSRVLGRFLQQKHRRGLSDEEDLWEAVQAVELVMAAFGMTKVKQCQFVKQQFDSFFEEFGRPHSMKQEIEHRFKKMQLQKTARKNRQSQFRRRNKQLEQSISWLAEKRKKARLPVPMLEKLAADIIHMHVNRLFSHDQRYFEMIVYFLAHRFLATAGYR